MAKDMEMRMIILAKPYGDHSNRLFQAIHYEAYCLDRGVSFFNITFDDMAQHYPSIKIGRRLKAIRLLSKCMLRARLTSTIEDVKQKSDLDKAVTGVMTIVGGWDFRAHDLTEKYQDHFAKKYSIDESLIDHNSVAKQIAEWKSDGQTVVGVHIRRGDYREFMDGRYYYSDFVYTNKIREIAKLCAARGGRARFVLFSNVPSSVCIGEELDCAVSRNDWHIDHWLMSQCDFLVGPPSTFTLWASYIGKTPYFHISDPKAPIDLSSFCYCRG
jgi:hypothetical protein